MRRETREFREQNNRVLNAMRQDLTDLRSDFTDLRSDLTGLRSRVDSGFDEVGRAFTDVRGRLDATAAGQEQIASMLTTLIERSGEE